MKVGKFCGVFVEAPKEIEMKAEGDQKEGGWGNCPEFFNSNRFIIFCNISTSPIQRGLKRLFTKNVP